MKRTVQMKILRYALTVLLLINISFISACAGTGSASSGNQEADMTPMEEPKDADFPPVIWIGDSLTQGSLGDNNFNENNPQAPWRVLADISGWDVSGVGLYGFKTDDIFWTYSEYDGIKDPSYIYVFWVGSNDFYESPDNIHKVIEETDTFMNNAGINKYLILGTTNRGDMDPDAYIGINKVFEETYSPNYLDIMPYVEYGPDNIHLTEGSYRDIAEAVYKKLKELYDQ